MTALDYVPRKQKACRRGIVEVLREEQATVIFGDYSADIDRRTDNSTAEEKGRDTEPQLQCLVNMENCARRWRTTRR